MPSAWQGLLLCTYIVCGTTWEKWGIFNDSGYQTRYGLWSARETLRVRSITSPESSEPTILLPITSVKKLSPFVLSRLFLGRLVCGTWPGTSAPITCRLFVGRSASYQTIKRKMCNLIAHRTRRYPISREIQPNFRKSQVINERLRECTEGVGFMLVQPQHLLSFQLG